jgi:hypothetical protein
MLLDENNSVDVAALAPAVAIALAGYRRTAMTLGQSPAEGKRLRPAAKNRPIRKAPGMAEAATASPPSSYFPARTLTLRNTHRCVAPANDTHPAALDDARVYL